MSRLQEMARRAETSRLTATTRGRILATVAAERSRTRRWMMPAFPGMTMGRALAAAAVLVVLAMPAVMFRTPGNLGTPAEHDMNLRARLQADGSVVLEWENGSTVHTIRRAGTAAGLAKVDGIKVAGERYVDRSSPIGEIVYYQID